MPPETTAPVATPQWATDGVVDFILQAKEAEDAAWWVDPSAAKPQQVDLNPKVVPEPVVPNQKELDEAAIDAKLKKEIEDQKKFDEDADALLKELWEPSAEPAKTTAEPDKKLENPELKEAMGRISQLSVEEQEQFITYVDELTKHDAMLSAEKIKSDQQLADLQYENQILKDSAKQRIEKLNSLEQDEARNKIPNEISELVVSFKDFSSKNDDFTKKAYRKELIRAFEKEFKRSLNDYIWDLYIWANDVISWQESSSIDLPPPSKSQTAKAQDEKSKVDMMANYF